MIKSYLRNKMNYTELNTKRLKIKTTGPYSVIQGSKLSSLMFTLYINEIPLIHKLLEDQEIMETVLNENAMKIDVDHEVQNFVDDSNSTMAFSDPENAKPYINTYVKLLEEYYNMSKIAINSDKTNVMVVNHPANESTAKNVTLETSKGPVKPKEQFRILGWIQCRSLSHMPHMNQVSKIVFGRLSAANNLKKYMSQECRQRFVRSHLISVIHYGLPLVYAADNAIKTKLHRITMACARFSNGGYGFRVSCRQLLKRIKLETIQEQIEIESAKFVNKLMFSEQPTAIMKLIKMPSKKKCEHINEDNAPIEEEKSETEEEKDLKGLLTYSISRTTSQWNQFHSPIL